MAAVAKPTKAGLEETPQVTQHKIRITLTSRNVKNLEKGTFGLIGEWDMEKNANYTNRDRVLLNDC